MNGGGFPNQACSDSSSLSEREEAGEVANLVRPQKKRFKARRPCGLLLVRQRLDNGIACYIMLEDETGVANLVVLPEVFARLIKVQGRIQRAPEALKVIHILAHRLINRSAGRRMQQGCARFGGHRWLLAMGEVAAG